MGMYHNYKFDFKLVKDLPDDVVNVLNYLSNDNSESAFLPELPKHKFFSNSRWSFFSQGSLFEDNSFEFEKNSLFIVGSIKNYEFVIEEFVDFINPYIDEPVGTFIGAYVFEEFYDPDIPLDDLDNRSYIKFYKKGK